MRKEIYWDNCVLKTQIPAVNNEGGQGGGGGSHHEFTNNNFVCFMSHKANGVFDLSHMFGWSLWGYKFSREASCRWV